MSRVPGIQQTSERRVLFTIKKSRTAHRNALGLEPEARRPGSPEVSVQSSSPSLRVLAFSQKRADLHRSSCAKVRRPAGGAEVQHGEWHSRQSWLAFSFLMYIARRSSRS